MKRNSKPFSVEIKKSRIPGQPHQRPSQRLFELWPAEAPKIFPAEEPQAVAEAMAAPRILPSTLEPVWSNPEPVEPVQRKRSSTEPTRRRMEFGLTATTSEVVKDAHTEVPAIATNVPQTDGARDEAEAALPVHDVSPAQDEGLRTKSSRPRKAASGPVEQEIASAPIPEAETMVPSMTSKASQRRLTKRLAAVAELPRHERWKGRLHPAAW
jgi:hypothetical protein